jgi:hypothetical protein
MPLFGLGLGAVGLGTLGGGLFSYLGATDQSDTAKDALAAQTAMTRAAGEQAARTGATAAELTRQYGDLAGGYLQDYGSQALGELYAGRDLAAGQLLGYGGMAEDALHQGYGGAIDTFSDAAGRSRSDMLDALGAYQGGVGGAQAQLAQQMQPVLGLQGYANQAANVANQFRDQSQMQRLMADPSGYMAQDPGYAFRQQQGEDAIRRAASAAGGRLSGNTLTELSKFNQNLASQEFGNASQRAQAADAATLQALGQQASIQSGLGQMGYGAQQNLASQMGQMGMQGAGGVADIYRNLATQNMQAGSNLAGLQQGYGQALGGWYGNQGQNLANLYTGTGSQLANAYSGLGTNMSNLLMNVGQGQGNALAGAGQQITGLAQTLIPSMTGMVPYAGAGYGAIGNTLSSLGSNLGYMAMNASMGAGSPQTGMSTPTGAGSATGTGGATGIPGVQIPGY